MPVGGAGDVGLKLEKKAGDEVDGGTRKVVVVLDTALYRAAGKRVMDFRLTSFVSGSRLMVFQTTIAF